MTAIKNPNIFMPVECSKEAVFSVPMWISWLRYGGRIFSPNMKSGYDMEAVFSVQMWTPWLRYGGRIFSPKANSTTAIRYTLTTVSLPF